MSVRFRILPGLPATGPAAIGFSRTGMGLHAEGLVVEFEPDDAPAWIGNFIPGMTDFHWLDRHPNGRDVLVIAGGQGYRIDPVRRTCDEYLDAFIKDLLPHPTRPWLLVNDCDLHFFAISPLGIAWRSPRISWDKLRNVRIEGERLFGEAWEFTDRWYPFELDLNTGALTGGSYNAFTGGG